MQPTTAPARLTQFRQEVYRSTLGYRKDSLFELLDALTLGSGPTALVRYSLGASFRRQWSSVPDALADGSLEPAALHRLLPTLLPPPDPALGGRPVWAIDATIWPRPQARTSPARTYGRQTVPAKPDHVIVGSWEYQWLVVSPEASGSWALPLDVRRRGPGAASPTATAIAQLRAVLPHGAPGPPAPIVTLDSSYSPVDLARAGVAADCLVRLPSRRRLYRRPPPYRGQGRPPRHGPVFRCHDPATHGPPDRHVAITDPSYGTLTVDVWEDLHAQGGHDVSFPVIRIQAARRPRHDQPPAPLWLAWVGGPLPDDLRQLWHWYRRRFPASEHGFRFAKHDLGWTGVRLRDPAAADRWTWLVALAVWQLWLARPLVADCRLPWERPLPPHRLTPGRVRRALPGAFAHLGTPARAPQPRGKAPGRRLGQRPGPHPRQPIVHRGTPPRRTKPTSAA
jgi:hypothetical protein